MTEKAWADMTDGERLRKRLGAYEFHAAMCGDRQVLKLSVDQAVEVLGSVWPDHFVIFTEDRWTVEHSFACRLSGEMHACPAHKAIATIAEDGYDVNMVGRWRITRVDSEGLPSLERTPQSGRSGDPTPVVP